MRHMKLTVALALAAVLTGPALAQLQTGNLYGTVMDDQGAPLPGVTNTLTCGGAPLVQVTNAQGQFRFLSLSPGGCSLKSELEGFSTIDYPNIVINVGRNTSIEVTMSAAVEDVITVTAESPLLDERRISTGATVAQTELEKIPTARDPWAILQSTPGVLTDRINVGGNESGQQSAFVGPGAQGDQAIWAVDGMVITDMAALGASPAYYDFDAFEEMQVTTGGSDTTIATGGVVLNMVTKRGTNEWRGSGRYYNTDESRQADTSFDNGELAVVGPWRNSTLGLGPCNPDVAGCNPQASFKAGNRIVSVKDYGAEVGGPILKDRLWIWGSYGRQKVDLLTVADVSDFTDLKTKNAKLNAQIAANNSATGFYFDSEKVKIGRNAGPTRPQETTWDQSHFGKSPTAYKAEDTHIFSSNFYLTGLYSHVNGGFQLVPEGGTLPTSPTATLGPDGVWHNTFLLYQTERPQDQYKVDASNFFNTGSLSHELKFGAGYRNAEVTSLSRWPGGGYVLDGPTNYGLPVGTNVFAMTRDSAFHIEQKYTSIYAQDTLTSGNLTVNVGVRYDKQEGKNLSGTAQAAATVPSILPTVSASGGDIGFEWTDISPRLGLTYALGAERKTLLRASYSRFADQLGSAVANDLNVLGYPGYAYIRTSHASGPGGTLTPGELLGPPFAFSANVNPFTGGLLLSNAIDPGLDAPQTDEVLLGVEHALLPEFVVGVNLTYRKLTNLIENEVLVFDGSTDACEDAGDPLLCPAFSAANLGLVGRRHQRSDYILTPFTQFLPDGSTRTIDIYRLRPGVSTRGGTFKENGDREQEYKGASLVFNKRLANRWMLRGNVTWANWEWSKVPSSELENPTLLLGGGNQEGDPVLQGSGTGSGSKGGIYINSEWSYSINGLYQIAPDRPWGFNVAANLTGRQGYPLPYFRRRGGDLARDNAATYNVQVTNSPDEFRLDDIHMVDARVEKEFTFSDFGLTVGLDVFNLFNESYVLQRAHRLNRTNSDNVQEIVSPRVLRLGARLSFR